MRRWKSALLKCLPVLSGELFAFLTLDILWTLLEYGPPFSLPLYLAAGAAAGILRRISIWAHTAQKNRFSFSDHFTQRLPDCRAQNLQIRTIPVETHQ